MKHDHEWILNLALLVMALGTVAVIAVALKE